MDLEEERFHNERPGRVLFAMMKIPFSISAPDKGAGGFADFLIIAAYQRRF